MKAGLLILCAAAVSVSLGVTYSKYTDNKKVGSFKVSVSPEYVPRVTGLHTENVDGESVDAFGVTEGSDCRIYFTAHEGYVLPDAFDVVIDGDEYEIYTDGAGNPRGIDFYAQDVYSGMLVISSEHITENPSVIDIYMEGEEEYEDGDEFEDESEDEHKDEHGDEAVDDFDEPGPVGSLDGEEPGGDSGEKDSGNNDGYNGGENAGSNENSGQSEPAPLGSMDNGIVGSLDGTADSLNAEGGDGSPESSNDKEQGHDTDKSADGDDGIYVPLPSGEEMLNE